MNRIPEYIEELLTALFSGEATDSEVDILRKWMDASAENAQLLEAYRKTNFAVTWYAKNSSYDADKAWKNVARALHKTSSSGRLRRMMKQAYRYAAVFVPAFAAGVAVMYFYASPETPEASETDVFFTEYTVPYGSKSMIMLPDSSSIWLNAGSKLRYGSDFNQTGREVFIEGEAYFKVARNEQKPFFVKTSAVTLKVLGTSFNVTAYPEENNVETTVESGSVQVLRNVEGHLMDKLVLEAGQKVTIIKSARMDSMLVSQLPAQASGPFTSRSSSDPKSMLPEKVAEKTIVTKNVTTELYTSWKDSRWLIRQESLESLAVKLERRYNVHISFADESLKNFSFSGTLLDETLEQVLEAIKLSAPVNYTIRKHTVRLSANRWIVSENNSYN
jgi:ferric-dicitrate binding protein FerR (iron transport regulator)